MSKGDRVTLCPFRKHTVHGHIDKETLSVAEYFMECYKEDCPSFFTHEKYDYATGNTIKNERCKLLSTQMVNRKGGKNNV